MARLIVLLIASGAGLFIAGQLMSFMSGTRSMKRQLRKDLRNLRAQIAGIKEALVPFAMDEFKILSCNPILKNKRRGSSILQKGFLSTIYQEPVFAFAIKDNSHKSKLLLVVESQDDEYLFNYENHVVNVEHNGKPLGLINSDHQLIDVKGQAVAKIEESASESYKKVLLDDREVAHINKFDLNTVTENDRLFSLFHEFNANDEEEFVALSLYELMLKPRIQNIRA